MPDKIEKNSPASTEDLYAAVTAFIHDYDPVSFAELAREWPEHFTGGKFHVCVQDYTNWRYWVGLSKEGGEVMTRIGTDRYYEMVPVSYLLYMIDGCTLDLPLVKSIRQYKKPHWIPAVITIRKSGAKARAG